MVVLAQPLIFHAPNGTSHDVPYKFFSQYNLVRETKAGHTKRCIGLWGFVLLSLSSSHPLLQDNVNQFETEWCNHHFFSVTIILPGEGLRMSVFHLCTRLCTNLAIVG
ncbi:hypothetical protein D9742_12510 [Escherichia sp. E1V33]|nr:hypothetical protein D9742_12510 [Escherichia sp. E1V33]TBR63994.1 hypothetical protein D9735_16165 [Escherichia sp. E1S7]